MTDKGIRYECAFRNDLRLRRGVVWAERFAASHGPFDVVAQWNHTPGGWIEVYQCKASRMTCRAATKLLTSVWNLLGMPSNFGTTVIHRTKEKEFCEH